MTHIITYSGGFNVRSPVVINFNELPKQSVVMDYKKPTTTREYVVWGSLLKTDIQLAAMSFAPLFDGTIDATTGLPITLFRGPIKVEEVGYGEWKVTVPYESSQSTVELNFTLGVQSTKIQQALADVKSYSCTQATSAATDTAVGDINTAMAITATDNAEILPLANIATTQANLATGAANLPAVDPAVKTQVQNCANACAVVVTNATTVQAAITAMLVAATSVVTDATAGDLAAVTLDAALATAAAATASNASTASDAANALATAAADAAVTLAGGGNGVTIFAANAADSAAFAANNADASITNALTNANAVIAAINAVITAMQADVAPGGNGVPNFNGAIGVNDDKVEGCDIEIGKVEFSITKKWPQGILPAVYFVTLADMTDRTVVNGAPFTFAWMGQTLTFATGSLRFRGAPIQWSSQGEISITYHFAYQRPILASDQFKVAGSGVITKEGWQYLWVRYLATPQNGRVVMIPKSVHINKVYPYDEFGKLQL